MPQRSGPKVWALLFVVLLLGVVGSVSYLGWRQSTPGVQAVATPPRFLGQKTAFTVVVEARGGNVAQVDVRVVQNTKSTSVVKQEGARVGRLEVPVAVDSAEVDNSPTQIPSGVRSASRAARAVWYAAFRRSASTGGMAVR